MVRFRYGDVYVEVEKASAKANSVIRSALTYRDPKSGMPYYLYRDGRFLTGLASRVYDALREARIGYRVTGDPDHGDITSIDVRDDLLDEVVLYPEYQVPAVIKSIYWQRGVVMIPTGGGKTETAAAIAKLLEERDGIGTLMVVPGINSMHQTWRRWQRRGIESVGRLGGGVQYGGETHLIAVADSLRQRIAGGDRAIKRYLERTCGCVLFMEAQHLPADTWMDIGTKLDLPYRIALSATPYIDEDGPGDIRDMQLIGMTGETLVEIPDSLVMDLGRMSTPIVHMVRMRGPWMAGERNWHQLNRHGIVGNPARNKAIVRMARRLAAADHRVLVLSKEIPHGQKLSASISKRVDNTFMFQGQSRFTTYRDGSIYRAEKKPIYEVADELEEIEGGYALTGSPAVDEDADLPDANVLINGSGGRAMGRLAQRSGRVLRAKPERDNIAHLIDFYDDCAFVLRAHSNRRKEIYEARYGAAKRFQILEHDSPDDAVDAVLAMSRAA